MRRGAERGEHRRSARRDRVRRFRRRRRGRRRTSTVSPRSASGTPYAAARSIAGCVSSAFHLAAKTFSPPTMMTSPCDRRRGATRARPSPSPVGTNPLRVSAASSSRRRVPVPVEQRRAANASFTDLLTIVRDGDERQVGRGFVRRRRRILVARLGPSCDEHLAAATSSSATRPARATSSALSSTDVLLAMASSKGGEGWCTRRPSRSCRSRRKRARRSAREIREPVGDRPTRPPRRADDAAKSETVKRTSPTTRPLPTRQRVARRRTR